jgi:hypothetical protein
MRRSHRPQVKRSDGVENTSPKAHFGVEYLPDYGKICSLGIRVQQRADLERFSKTVVGSQGL